MYHLVFLVRPLTKVFLSLPSATANHKPCQHHSEVTTLQRITEWIHQRPVSAAQH